MDAIDPSPVGRKGKMQFWWQTIRFYGKTGHLKPVNRNFDLANVDASQELLELYQTLYEHENAAREAITARLQIPLAIGVSVVTAQGFLFSAARWSEWDVILAAFAGLMVVAFGLIFIAGVLFFRISSGHAYEYLPTPIELEAYRRECETTFSADPNAQEYMSGWIVLTMNREILRLLAICASKNSLMNAERSEAILTVYRFLLASILATVASFAFFAIGDLKETPVYHVAAEITQVLKNPSHVELVDGFAVKQHSMENWISFP